MIEGLIRTTLQGRVTLMLQTILKQRKQTKLKESGVGFIFVADKNNIDQIKQSSFFVYTSLETLLRCQKLDSVFVKDVPDSLP